jgi:hypothetical protein
MRLSPFVLPTLLTASLVLGVGACGPGAQGDDTAGDDSPGGPDGGDAPDAFQGQLSRISGNVWMPLHGPTAPDPIPVFGAVVYVSTTKPPPIPQNVYCERCVDAPGNAVYTSHDGSFELSVIPGTYWLVIQKGQWRVEQQITFGAGATTLQDYQTTLPANHNPDLGLWIPKVAIVLGTNDNIEDVLAKVGFDTLNGTQFVDVPNSEVTVYGSNQAGTLLNDLDLLRQFHIVFFPCNTGIDDGDVAGLDNQASLANLRRYVNEGGKLYVTDWSGEMMDRPFPPQITLGGGVDSVGTYDPMTFTGTLSTLGSANGGSYTSPDGEAVDQDLKTWLGLQMAPSPSNPTPALINPTNFQISGAYNYIDALNNSVVTGMDAEGLPIYDVPKAWVIGSKPGLAGGKRPMAVTFEPTGCGRVLYSVYQTADGSHAGLHPQERVLLFLITEIGVCSDAPIVD